MYAWKKSAFIIIMQITMTFMPIMTVFKLVYLNTNLYGIQTFSMMKPDKEKECTNQSSSAVS